MSSEVEIWFDSPPPPSALADSLSRFGRLHEMRDGSLRLIEGDEDPGEGVPFLYRETSTVPAAVRLLAPRARACLHASAVLSGSRGFWLGRMAVEIQTRLGGIIYVPSSGVAYPDARSFEHSWPSDHGGHGDHGDHGSHE